MSKLIAAFLVAATLTGCNSEIDHAEVETKNGLIYKYGDTDPFTGQVLNQPIGVPGITLAACNSQVEKGRYSGKSECFAGEQLVYELEFSAGRKDGSETVFDVKTGKKKSVKNWRIGLQHGVEETYLNGNLVSRKEYRDGKPDGEEIRWSDDGETVLTELTWRAGNKYDGYETTSEGKANYLNGQLHGPQVNYSYFTGKFKRYVSEEKHYNNGKLDGIQKNYKNTLHTEIVQQESEFLYDNGTATSGWFRTFDVVDGKLLQDVKLIRTTQNKDDNDRHSNYPKGLAPDGLVKPYNFHTGTIDGEELWANGVKVKYYSDIFLVDDEPVFYILDTSAPGEKYKQVSRDEYLAYLAVPSLSSSTMENRASPAASSQECLDAWISAFREGMGEDAMIVSEQLNEWTDWCSEGRLP
jgi:antitoxin component YwqK of YwqJK toxin-antitoxin module